MTVSKASVMPKFDCVSSSFWEIILKSFSQVLYGFSSGTNSVKSGVYESVYCKWMNNEWLQNCIFEFCFYSII